MALGRAGICLTVNGELTPLSSDNRSFISINGFALLIKAPLFIAAVVLAMVVSSTMGEAAPARQESAPQEPLSLPGGIRRDTPSGLPVPRFVSLKTNKTYCRAGPSFAYPVKFTFLRKGLPVVIVAETRDHWRKIRDAEGDECWIHHSKLSSGRMVMVISNGLALRARPDFAAPAKAHLGKGLIARVDAEKEAWLKITVDGQKGWAEKSGIWGDERNIAISATKN